jgi:hypothetical protein
VAVAVVSILIGIALARLPLAGGGGRLRPTELDTLPVAVPVTITTTTSVVDRTPAAVDAVAAVEGFLGAEVAGDYEAAFGFLSSADRAAFGSAAGWVAAHAMVLPPITGFGHLSGGQVPGGAEVRAELTLAPGLDQVTGLTPGEADSVWRATEEEGGWRVSFSESVIRPRYLDDEAAPAAVREWAEERQACRKGAEPRGVLLGQPSLADRLCGSRGAVEVGMALPLDDATEAAAFLAAYGPEVGEWARVVPLQAPVGLRAVVAPVGDRWLVIGVLSG